MIDFHYINESLAFRIKKFKGSIPSLILDINLLIVQVHGNLPEFYCHFEIYCYLGTSNNRKIPII